MLPHAEISTAGVIIAVSTVVAEDIESTTLPGCRSFTGSNSIAGNHTRRNIQVGIVWLGGRDSNPDSQIQSLVSYHWTTSQQGNALYEEKRLVVNRAKSPSALR